jgi:HEAT repeat protein
MTCYDDLVTTLRKDPDRMVRSQAAFSLGELGKRYYSVGFNPLVDSLENDPSAFVRSASALALSCTRDSRAVAPLVAALKDTERGEVAVRQGKKVRVYRACVSDAARSSLEKVLEMSFTSVAETAQAQRDDIAAQWDSWYQPRRHRLPGATAFAKK